MNNTEETLWNDYRQEKSKAALNDLVTYYWQEYGNLIVKCLLKKYATIYSEADISSWCMETFLFCILRYEPDKGASFKTYAFQRCHGVILDDLRRKSKQESNVVYMDKVCDEYGDANDWWLVDTNPTPEEAILAKTDHAMLVALLKKLTLQERKICYWYYYRGISQKKISKTLGVTEARVSQIRKGALKKLRSAIDG